MEYLHKKNLLTDWKKRYMVIRFGELNLLSETGKSKERIVLDQAISMAKQGNVMEVKQDGKVVVTFRAEDEKRSQEWINAIAASKIHFLSQKSNQAGMVYSRAPLQQ